MDQNDIVDLLYFANGPSGSYNSYKLTDGEGQVIVQWTGNFNKNMRNPTTDIQEFMRVSL